MEKTRGLNVKTVRPLVLALAIVVPAVASATPSTTYWAPSAATCQGKYVPHVTYDTYYGKGTPIPAGTVPASGITAYPIDTGLEMGILPWGKLQAEASEAPRFAANPDRLLRTS